MGLFSKKKKKDPGKAKEAASARAASAEKKQDTAGQETAVEKPVPERAKKTSEEYSEEMLSRSKQFWEYQNRFAFTKESVESVSSLRKLNQTANFLNFRCLKPEPRTVIARWRPAAV